MKKIITDQVKRDKPFKNFLEMTMKELTFSNQSVEIASRKEKARKKHCRSMNTTPSIACKFAYPTYLVSEDYHIVDHLKDSKVGLLMEPNRPITAQAANFVQKNLKEKRPLQEISLKAPFGVQSCRHLIPTRFKRTQSSP